MKSNLNHDTADLSSEADMPPNNALDCPADLKVLDCTIRDGGLMNNSRFTFDEVKAVYQACLEAGVDCMEIGYLNSRDVFSPDDYGPWRHCTEEDLRRAVGDHCAARTGMKLAVMIDAGGKSDWRRDLLPGSESVLDTIRVACYADQIDEAVEMLHHAHDLGYETFLNIMAISTVPDDTIDHVLEAARTSPADVVVIVDSNGNLFRRQVAHLVRKYRAALDGSGKAVGMHAHNNLQLAFANTLEAIALGCRRVDSTLLGLGRGAGNCQTEILLGCLKNPRYSVRPILKVIQETILPMRRRLDWGPSIPYHITGQLNVHPREAMAFRGGPTPDDYVAFYDQMVAENNVALSCR